MVVFQRRLSKRGHSKRGLAALCLILLVGGCAGSGEESGTFLPSGRYAVQPFPENYKADILAFMHTYLNDLRSVRGAAIAPPEQRTIGDHSRYVVCLRYATAQGESSERAAVFLDGRMERLIEKGRELCANASYTPFPEMEKLTR